MKVPNTLRYHRDIFGLTQQGLADKAGIAYRTVQDLERGVAAPTLDSQRALCRALGMTVEVLWPEEE